MINKIFLNNFIWAFSFPRRVNIVWKKWNALETHVLVRQLVKGIHAWDSLTEAKAKRIQ